VSLPLPQLYTAYYLSPIFAALLAGPMLGERIQISSWIAGGLGFLGVLITIAPTHSPLPAMLPALLGLGAALMWALSSVLYRRNVHHGTGLVIVVFSNVVIGALSAPLAWHWQHIDAYKALILLVVAVAGLAAHFLYISGMRRVSVAVAGPVGFFSLIWSVLLAYLIWGEVPRAGFLAGAGLIVLAGLIVFGGEWRRTRSAVRAARLS
jgi:S-adenosylmethionine uptake transporter